MGSEPEASMVDTRDEPHVVRTHAELTQGLHALRFPGQEPCPAPAAPLRAGRTLALVPTMGALHEAHLSLIRSAREHADAAVVSIFVNPLQFGPGEDFERYPRAFGADLEVCRAEGVELVFAPPLEMVYPEEPTVRVSSGAMGERLEGASRPGHFDGVLTMVLKLFQLVRPDVAVFGEKDAQQLALVRRMVRDFNAPVRVVAGPTVRDSDGLAISSRNAYLSGQQRATALALSRALQAGSAAAQGGAEAVRRAGREVLENQPDLQLDYLALVEPHTFTEVSPDHSGAAVLALAAKIGSTRLIDNTPITIPPSGLEG